MNNIGYKTEKHNICDLLGRICFNKLFCHELNEEGISATFSMTPICNYRKGRRALHTDLCTAGTVTSFINLFFNNTEATAVLTTGPKISAIFESHYNLKPWMASKLPMKTEENTPSTLISTNFYIHFTSQIMRIILPEVTAKIETKTISKYFSRVDS